MMATGKKEEFYWHMLLAMALAAALLVLILTVKAGFADSKDRIVTEEGLPEMTFSSLTGVRKYVMDLKKSDTLRVHFSLEKGNVRLTIAAKNGEELYRGSGTEVTDFLLTVPADGRYIVTVDADHASGELSVTQTGRRQ